MIWWWSWSSSPPSPLLSSSSSSLRGASKWRSCPFRQNTTLCQRPSLVSAVIQLQAAWARNTFCHHPSRSSSITTCWPRRSPSLASLCPRCTSLGRPPSLLSYCRRLKLEISQKPSWIILHLCIPLVSYPRGGGCLWVNYRMLICRHPDWWRRVPT